jgi:hypothetical protein
MNQCNSLDDRDGRTATIRSPWRHGGSNSAIATVLLAIVDPIVTRTTFSKHTSQQKGTVSLYSFHDLN